MSAWNIILPNNHRASVKIQPNTKVLEVLEEACKRNGLDYNEHQLVHNKRSIDISLTTRLSGVTNNATLDLRRMDTPRKFQDVVIVLQCPDGSKLSPKSFTPNLTTFEMILQAYQGESDVVGSALAEDEASGTYMTCTYVNDQICGIYQLRNTTLKDLGLLNGRGLIRFDLVKLEQDQFRKKSADFEQKMEKKVKLDAIYEQKRRQLMAEEEEEKKRQKTCETTQVKSENEPKSARTVNALGPVQSEDLIKIIEKPVTGEFPTFKFDDKNKEPKVGSKSDQRPAEIPAPRQPVNEFANFKFPEETKGMTLNNVNELYEMEKESKEACDRQPVLVAFKETTDESERMESNDLEFREDVFDLTTQDLKRMLSDLKKIQGEEGMLMTKQMRELEQDKKAMRYPYVAIRVCFKDRSFLQGFFRPKELMTALYKFVEDSIKPSGSSEKDFYLYTTPPKQVLKDKKKNLFEHQLWPAAQVYFKNESDTVPSFSPDIKFVSMDEAQDMVHTNIHQKVRDVNTEGMDFLQREQAAVGKIIGQSGMTSGGSRSYQRPVQASRDESTKKKLNLFLGKK